MQEELHPDIEDLAPMQANPAAPAALAPAAKAVGSAVAPNLTGLATGEAAPPIAPLPSYGKVPSADDPRINQAIGEFGELGATLLPMLTPGSAISLGSHVLSKLANPALGVAAGATALTAASVGPAQAQKLTRTQKQELEVKRQQLQMEGQEASRRASEAMSHELELRRQGLQFEAESKQKEAEGLSQIALNKQREELDLNRAEEARKANLPFREKFPNLSTAMSNTGLAVAALLPFGTRIYQASKAAPFVRAWENVATEAEAALKSRNMDHARILVDQLVSFKKEAIALEKKGTPSNAVINTVSATAPMEFQMLPELIDLGIGSAEAKGKAKDTVFDPVRIPASLLQGATFAALGAKAPIPGVVNNAAVRAQSEGLIKSMKDMRTAATRKSSKVEGAGVKITEPDINKAPVNANKESYQINPTAYEEAQISQSFKKLGKTGPELNVVNTDAVPKTLPTGFSIKKKDGNFQIWSSGENADMFSSGKTQAEAKAAFFKRFPHLFNK